MSRIGHREYFLLKISDINIESLIDEIKSTMFPPREYDVNLSPGKYGVDIVISGVDEGKIKEIDLEISSKVLEICEKRNIECHLIGPLEIL